MNKQVFSMLGLCVLAIMVAAPSYAEPGGVKAKVPFEFVVGSRTFPAGEYRIVTVPHRVDIRDANGRKLAVVLANEISEGSVGENGKVIFHCYGEKCFLSEVWSPDYEQGQIVSSQSEQELVKKESSRYVTVVGEKLRSQPNR